jgi:hypothetical protein
MRVPPAARHHRRESGTPPLARRDSPPSATAGGGPAPGRTCVCRQRPVTIAASRAHPASRDGIAPPRPRLAEALEGRRQAAHACAASGPSPSSRAGHAPCRSRDVIAPPRPHIRVLPAAHRHRSELGTALLCPHRAPTRRLPSRVVRHGPGRCR